MENNTKCAEMMREITILYQKSACKILNFRNVKIAGINGFPATSSPKWFKSKKQKENKFH